MVTPTMQRKEEIMAERLQHETFTDLKDAIKRYIDLSKRYEDVRLEQFIYLDKIVMYTIEYRYVRH